MPISGEQYDFSSDNVNNRAPEQPGVYALYSSGTLIYYGRASVSIRARLKSHYDGNEGPCTRAATHYAREVCSNPVNREVELLREFQAANHRLPRCNERIG